MSYMLNVNYRIIVVASVAPLISVVPFRVLLRRSIVAFTADWRISMIGSPSLQADLRVQLAIVKFLDAARSPPDLTPIRTA